MLTTRQRARDGFLEIALGQPATPIRGAALTYSLDGGAFVPCAIYPGQDADALLETTFWTWNQAVQFGRVRFTGKARPVYWNLYLNGLHRHHGPVTLRADVLSDAGVERFEQTVELQPARAVYLDAWDAWTPANRGWRVIDGQVVCEPGGNRDMQPIRVPVNVRGRFDVVVGLRAGVFTGMLTCSRDGVRRPFVVSAKHPELADKVSKEIRWRTAELEPGDWIEIAPTPAAVRDPKISPPGGIAYLKLVPADTPKRVTADEANDERTLALYFEPYSWAYFYNLTTPQQVRDVVRMYRELGATEVHNQLIRFGSKALHHSRVAERFERGAMMADDGTFSDAPTQMVRSIDVLQEMIAACRELGLKHYANAALSNCYPGTDFEERISRDHPDWRAGNVLRFNRPETRAYAAAVIAEFVEWGTDGLSIDCLRYPDHHTEEDLVLLFREIRAAADKAASGRFVPLTVRIPANDPVYFRAFDTLVKERAVQTVVPSTVFPREPYTSVRPYLKWKDHGCRVLGIVDGWKAWVGTFCDNFQLELLLSPRDIRDDIRRYLREGADGIFVYQGDAHLADPFTGPVLDWTRRK